MDKVRKWRNASSEAGCLAGFDSKSTKTDSELVKEIIKDIARKLNRKSTLSELKGLVGIRDSIEELKLLLEMDSSGVRIVCIWGMGGIGKTTLARALLNEMSSKFEACYFLAKGMEEEMYGPKHLKDRPLLKVLKKDDIVRTILLRTRVLIIVDDVNKSSQLDFLADCHDLFCSGSRLIITTRDKQLMGKLPHQIYMIKELNCDKALELFELKAFDDISPSTEFTELPRRFVDYCKGIPLALKILGSFLYGKNQIEWEGELNKLKQFPNPQIQDVLKLSYHGLHKMEKSTFLDIACFYKGKTRDFAKNLLDDNESTAEASIGVLIDKSLISIIEGNRLWMHDLLQEMGWAIARQHNNEPGKCSRLWIAEDVCKILKNNTGTDKVEGIVLNISENRDISEIKESRVIRRLSLSHSVFRKMDNLKLLKIYKSTAYDRIRYKVQLPGGLHSLPDSLRYLCWDGYPLKSLPSRFSPSNLVELHMPHCQVVKLFDETKNLTKLKKIDLSFSNNLIEVPNLSHCLIIESICLLECTSLVEVPSYFRVLEKLTSLDLFGCSQMRNIPDLGSNMEYLNLGRTAIKELPSSIWSLEKLDFFSVCYCKYLKSLPNGTCKLNSLKWHFNLFDCTSLRKLPAELPNNIVYLYISKAKIEEVPPSIKCLSRLEVFHLKECRRLVSLPTSICKLKYLQSLHLSGCPKFKCFPEILEPMEKMLSFVLEGTAITELPSSIENLTGLTELGLPMCENLDFVPNSISNLANLKGLMLDNCKSLQYLPELPFLLQHFSAHGCTSLKMVSSSEMSLTRGWDEYEVRDRREELIISNCLKLNLNALSSTLFDAQLRVMRLATAASKQIDKEIDHEFRFDDRPKVSIFFPGNEIPKWFRYQTEGSSIHFELPPQWFNSSFLGFALCAVVSFTEDPDCNNTDVYNDDEYDYADKGFGFGFGCKTHFKTNNGDQSESDGDQSESQSDGVDGNDFSFYFYTWDGEKEARTVNSDHVLVWYDYSKYLNEWKGQDREEWLTILADFTEAFFHFYLVDEDESPINIRNVKVKKCGISLLYAEDAENDSD